MKIWIDTASGTWGEVDGDAGRLMIVDLDEIGDTVETLESASDFQVAEYADMYGRIATGSTD